MPGLEPLGVPRELRGTAQVFEWGDLERFDRIIAEHGDRLAAVVMEPCRGQDPDPGYLEHIRTEAHRVGALLIFDETSIGFRLERAGAHARFGVDPDMAAFGKSLGNGHAIGAVIGTAAAMEGAEHSFISSSYWTEGVGPAAAVAAVTKMTQQLDVPALVAAVGRRVKEAWQRQASAAGVPMVVDDAYPCIAHAAFDHEQAKELSTLYTHLMLERGFLAPPVIYCSVAHTEEVLDKYEAAMVPVMAELGDAIRKGDIADGCAARCPWRASGAWSAEARGRRLLNTEVNDSKYVALIDHLRGLPAETEWLEFKRSFHAPEQLGSICPRLRIPPASVASRVAIWCSVSTTSHTRS